jgi:hypothetical protein
MPTPAELSSPPPIPAPTASARRSRAGEQHAARAIGLLSRWSRAAHWHLMFSGPCGCCAGDAQLIHLERQAIGVLEERVGRDPALASLLARCRSEDQGEARPLGQLMRSIATERDPARTAGHGALLDALEALLDSMEGDGQ